MRRKPLSWEGRLLLNSSKALRRRVHVVGHPSAPIGMGEHARSVFKALHAAGETARLVDIYGPGERADHALIKTYAEHLAPALGDGVNIFCINADEVPQASATLENRNLRAKGSKNIIYPAWELYRYPDEWMKILNGFDEIWAPSRFIAESLSAGATVPVKHMPLACEVGRRALLSRRHFGLPDSAYCFLFAFDFLSYIERKNPYATLEAFERAIASRPDKDVRLVIKLNNTHVKQGEFEQFKRFFRTFKDRVLLVEETLTDLEMKSLIWLCDCFVSLHRSEGFGRGISEAMTLGKPTIATGYSGNMDFCNEETCLLVPFELVPVEAGTYPHWQKQVWADPDTEKAAEHMVSLLDNPGLGEKIGRQSRNNMLANFSFLRRGLEYMNRCEELLST